MHVNATQAKVFLWVCKNLLLLQISSLNLESLF